MGEWLSKTHIPSVEVYYDANQMAKGIVDGYHTKPVPKLFAVLIHVDNEVVANKRIGSRRSVDKGKFVIYNIKKNLNYRVTLLFTQPSLGCIIPGASLPLFYRFTGGFIGVGVSFNNTIEGNSQSFSLTVAIENVNIEIIYCRVRTIP